MGEQLGKVAEAKDQQHANGNDSGSCIGAQRRVVRGLYPRWGSNCPKSAGNLSGWIESAYGRTRRLLRWFGLDLSWEVFRSILRYLVHSHSIRFQTLGSCIVNFSRQIDSFATAVWNSCSTPKTQQLCPCMSHCTEKGWAFYTWRYLFLISTSRLTSPEFTWFFPPPIKITRQNIATEL